MKTFNEELKEIETGDDFIDCVKSIDVRDKKIDEIIEWINKHEEGNTVGDKTKFEINNKSITIEAAKINISNEVVNEITKRVCDDIGKKLKTIGVI